MKNYVQTGDVLTLTAPYLRTPGQGALVGSIFGVATNDVASGAAGEFKLGGVHDLDKVSAQAWTAGALIYWDDATKLATTAAAAGANTLIGTAILAAANPSATGRVRLNGAFIS
jgi:predicted RecA/RadA family phage recombinase